MNHLTWATYKELAQGLIVQAIERQKIEPGSSCITIEDAITAAGDHPMRPVIRKIMLAEYRAVTEAREHSTGFADMDYDDWLEATPEYKQKVRIDKLCKYQSWLRTRAGYVSLPLMLKEALKQAEHADIAGGGNDFIARNQLITAVVKNAPQIAPVLLSFYKLSPFEVGRNDSVAAYINWLSQQMLKGATWIAIE